MHLKIRGSIEILAPADDVFEWLTDRAKLTAWAGSDPGWLPADGSELALGYRAKANLPTPAGVQEADFEVTAYDRPHRLEYVETYAGGRSVAGYTLEPSAGGTVLTLEATTDAGETAPPPVPEAVTAQLEHVPFLVRLFWRHQLHKQKDALAAFTRDGNPQFQAAMDAQLTAQLQRLKQLIEVMETEKSA